MIFFKKKFLLLIIFILSNNITLGYNFFFSNVTERFLVICYKLEGLSQEYYQIIPPDQSVSHYFYNVHCFGHSILWAELKETDAFGNELPFRGGIDLMDPETGEIPMGVAQNLFKSMLANKYAFIPMQIKVVDNETFQMTANAAAELMQGIDRLSCQTINVVLEFLIPSSTDNKQDLAKNDVLTNKPLSPKTIKKCRFGLGQIAKGGADLAGVSLCRDLHFVIVDTGEIGTPTPTKSTSFVSRVRKPILIAEINQGG